MPTGLYRGIGWDADPFNMLRNFQDEIGHVLSGSWPYANAVLREREAHPRVNVWTNGNRAIIEAELPGINPDEVDVTVLKNAVTLRGNRAAPETAKESSLIQRERSRGEFFRSIELPFAVQSEGVEAKYQNGILTVTLPRAEADRPKKIAVRS